MSSSLRCTFIFGLPQELLVNDLIMKLKCKNFVWLINSKIFSNIHYSMLLVKALKVFQFLGSRMFTVMLSSFFRYTSLITASNIPIEPR